MKSITSALLALALTAFVTTAAAEAGRSQKPWHKGMTGQCATCHTQAMPRAATGFKCTSCHGNAEAMAAKTAKLGTRNPHTSIHFGTGLDCVECHKEHSEPYNYCTEACHRTWSDKIPGKKGA